MKLRTGFVSNSSSSSFMLVGDVFDADEIIRYWEKKTGKNANEAGIGAYDALYDLSENLRIENGIDTYYDHFVVGLDYNNMEANETRLQFESRIKDELDRAFPGRNNKVCCRIDGGYEG